MSHPSRGGWIEIIPHKRLSILAWSHPSRGGWIEISLTCLARLGRRSHPSRGGWIEIRKFLIDNGVPEVPPLAGWVD